MPELSIGAHVRQRARELEADERELESLIADIRDVARRAELRLQDTTDLEEITSEPECTMVRAMSRRAKNVRDLARKMHAQTLDF
jgi:hypothetical protein